MEIASVLLIGLGVLVVFLVVAYVLGNKRRKEKKPEVAPRWNPETVHWAEEKAKLIKEAPISPKPVEVTPVPAAVTNKTVPQEKKLRISEPELTQTPPGNPVVDILDPVNLLIMETVDKNESPKTFHEQLLEDKPVTVSEPVHHSSPSHDYGHSDHSHDSSGHSHDSGSHDSGGSDGGNSGGSDGGD